MSKITLVFACLVSACSAWRVQVPAGSLHVHGRSPTPKMQDDDFLVNLAKDPKNMLSADSNADPLFGSPPAAAPAAAAPAAPSAAPGMAPGDDFLTELAKDPKNMLSADSNADPLFGSPPAAAPAAEPAAPAAAAPAAAAPAAPSAAAGVADDDDFYAQMAKDPKNMMTDPDKYDPRDAPDSPAVAAGQGKAGGGLWDFIVGAH